MMQFPGRQPIKTCVPINHRDCGYETTTSVIEKRKWSKAHGEVRSLLTFCAKYQCVVCPFIRYERALWSVNPLESFRAVAKRDTMYTIFFGIY